MNSGSENSDRNQQLDSISLLTSLGQQIFTSNFVLQLQLFPEITRLKTPAFPYYHLIK